MIRALASFFVLLIALLLAGCDGELQPAKRCLLTDNTLGRKSQESELTPAKVTELNEWLASHRKGWKTKISDLPPTGLEIHLDQPKGKKAHLYLLGNQLWFKNHYRDLSTVERAELEHILAPANRLPLFPYNR